MKQVMDPVVLETTKDGSTLLLVNLRRSSEALAEPASS